MADARGNLALEFLRLAGRLRPAWLVWENVPGVLSSNGGRDFGAFLGGLVELGYGFAYRVLDAQHFGVPQRRRRVFVVGHPGDWRRAVAVLFERSCLSGHPAPRREAGAGVAFGLAARSGNNRGYDGQGHNTNYVAGTLPASNGGVSSGYHPVVPAAFGGNNTAGAIDVATARNGHSGPCGRLDFETETFVVGPLCSGGTPNGHGTAGINRQAVAAGHVVPVPFIVNAAESCAKASHARPSEVARCIDSTGSFANAQGGTVVKQAMAVRRLTPRECERLQGFPDDYTLVEFRGKPMADGPRYKMIGNSMAVVVMRWLGVRIALVHALSA
jgi:DNA (cytosine-5)-methyltransferase 1